MHLLRDLKCTWWGTTEKGMKDCTQGTQARDTDGSATRSHFASDGLWHWPERTQQLGRWTHLHSSSDLGKLTFVCETCMQRFGLFALPIEFLGGPRDPAEISMCPPIRWVELFSLSSRYHLTKLQKSIRTKYQLLELCI